MGRGLHLSTLSRIPAAKPADEVTGWRVVAGSATGRHHQAAGKGNEDSIECRLTPTGIHIAALADGAGSAHHAAEGSRLAVEHAAEWLAECEPEQLERAINEAVTVVRKSLAQRAKQLRKRPRQLASTLLLAAWTQQRAWLLQLGDGAVVLRHEGKWLRPLEPHKGEFAGETVFTTSRDARALARVVGVELEGVDAIALMSDGLEPVATDTASGEPFAPFFDPLLAYARRELPVEELSQGLQAFLESDRIQERTSDDLSLLFACLP